MRFGKIFSKSLGEYRSNFGVIFKLFLLFIGIPSLLLIALQLPNLISAELPLTEVSGLPPIDSPTFVLFLLLTIIVIIAAFVFQLFAEAGLIGVSVKKSKFNFKELVKMGRATFWKFLGYSIVVGLFTFGLFLLLIIPGVIFAVFWVFSVYILFNEKTGILESLRRSRQLVKGKWWKTFGYIVLFSLILLLISWAGGIITSLIQTILATGLYSSVNSIILLSLLVAIVNFIVALIQVPLSILFFKNFYLEMKGEKGKSKSD
tara:strand:+ start:120 stop:902 length:783 start_codon:yes stop_codon:yes gene_type:complete